MACVICQHPERRTIEDYIAVIDVPGADTSLQSTAAKFGVPITDLQVHAIMHTPMARIAEDEEAPTLASQMKRGEANLLYAVAEEYYATMRQVGKEVRRRVTPQLPASATGEPSATEVLGRLTKELVDLYLGTGNNLRQTIATIVEMNQKLNDESDPALKALQGIIQAVRGPAYGDQTLEDDGD